MDKFILHSEYAPTGDQPQAIEALVNGFKERYILTSDGFVPVKL